MTDTTTATTAPGAVDRYLRFWNADPGTEQSRLATEVFADDVRYRAPIGAYDGRAALIEVSRQFAEHLGDVAFRARTEPEFHHDRARLLWEVLRGDESFATGTDVLTFADDGRIAEITAFLDRAPEGFNPHEHHEESPVRG